MAEQTRAQLRSVRATLKFYKGKVAGTYHHDNPVAETVASRHALACGPPALKLLVQLATGRALDVKRSASKRNGLATSLAREGGIHRRGCAC